MSYSAHLQRMRYLQALNCSGTSYNKKTVPNDARSKALCSTSSAPWRMAMQRLQQLETISRFAAGVLMTRTQLASRFFWREASRGATLQFVPSQQQRQRQQQRQQQRQMKQQMKQLRL